MEASALVGRGALCAAVAPATLRQDDVVSLFGDADADADADLAFRAACIPAARILVEEDLVQRSALERGRGLDASDGAQEEKQMVNHCQGDVVDLHDRGRGLEAGQGRGPGIGAGASQRTRASAVRRRGERFAGGRELRVRSRPWAQWRCTTRECSGWV